MEINSDSGKTNINFLKNFIPMTIMQHDVFGMIDSGSDICVANIDVLSKYSGLSKYFINNSDKCFITTAGSKHVKIDGCIILPVSIADCTVKIKFYLVKNLLTDFILGLDFLNSHNVTVNFGKNKFSIDPRRKLQCEEHVTVPPNCEAVIVAHIVGKPLPNSVVGIASHNDLTNGLLHGNTLCNVHNDSVFVRVANFNSKPIDVHRGTELGQFVCLSTADQLYDLSDTCNKSPVTSDKPSKLCKINSVLDEKSKGLIENVIDEFSDVFASSLTDLGKCDLIEHDIHVAENVTPIRQRAYRLSHTQKVKMTEILNDMLASDIIQESTSPWSSPAMLVSKKGHSGYRFVVDYRKLNSLTDIQALPLPTVDEALDNLGVHAPVWFSSVDLHSGFYQLSISKRSRPFTAFRTHNGLFEFKRLPQGLANSPGTFQRVMEAVLKGLHFQTCLIYLDDVIIFSRTIEDHIKHLREVFSRFRSAGLKLKPSKCYFAQSEIKYLGHTVSKDGIYPDKDKISAVQNYATPKNLKELRAFLGLSGYYRKHIQGYSDIASPLYKLTKKDVPFIWSNETEVAFAKLKEKLVNPPVLGFPNLDQPFRLYTDCSNVALGSVLCQIQGEKEVVISYYSRCLTSTEHNFSVTDKEGLSLVASVKHFDCYLRHTRFDAIVDHSALKYLFSLKNPTGRLARWIAFLQSYNMTIIYRPGKIHGNADGLSRSRCDNDKPKTKVTKVSALTETADNFTQDLQVEKCISMDEIIEKQKNDPLITPFIDFFTQNKLPNDQKKRHEVMIKKDQFFMCKGALYHVDSSKRRNVSGDVHLQLVIPRPLVPKILHCMHDSNYTGGHLGIARTIAKTRLKYYWEHMYSDVVNWIESCVVCIQRKRPHNPVRAHVTAMPIGSPFERISTDILGPLPVCTGTKNKYVLVFVDYFTKYVELIPVPNITAQTVANEFLKNIICRHSVPKYLHSDRGSNYLSNIVKEVCKLLKVKKTQTTSFHPMCNGQSERFMSFILNSLSKYISDNKHDDWDRHIPFIQFVYNTTPCLDSTDFTPYFLTHGRNPTTFMDLTLDLPDDIPLSTTEYIFPLVDRLQKAQDLASQKLDERKDIMIKRTNRKINEPKFNVGETVYLYRPVVLPGKTKKFLRPWVGPFIVAEKLSDIHVKLRRVSDGKLIVNRVHINRLKHGTTRYDDFDDSPIQNVDALEPAILADSEVPPDNLIENMVNDVPDNESVANDNETDIEQMYEVEKILRKRFVNNHWQYRVKWMTFDSKYNSWVEYEDLSDECKKYVDKMHINIPTDKRSKRKN